MNRILQKVQNSVNIVLYNQLVECLPHNYLDGRYQMLTP